MRPDQREYNQLRPIIFRRSYLKDIPGSVLIEAGATRVLCAASIDEKVPPFLRDQKRGWLTAEYAMLPCSSPQRIPRESGRGKISGRSQEIMRLIGRSLRAVIDFEALGERTILVDCDVIQADGGTRCASITGAFLAVADALRVLVDSGKISKLPLKDYVAAVSVGLFQGEVRLDLDYAEDSTADVDMNVVATGSGNLIEVGSTAEKAVFTKEQFQKMLDLGLQGTTRLVELQKKEVSL
jgi:ribonuclease PH